MNKMDKFWYIIGAVIGAFTVSLTAPTISTYFYSLVDSNVIAAAGMTTLLLKFIMAKVTTNKKALQFFRRHFNEIILIDCVFGTVVSCFGLINPEVRFIGMAIQGAITSYLWFKLMTNLAARRISGDELTILGSLSEYLSFASGLIGCTIAFFVSLDAEVAVMLQCVGNCLMAVTDTIAFKRLKKEE